MEKEASASSSSKPLQVVDASVVVIVVVVLGGGGGSGRGDGGGGAPPGSALVAAVAPCRFLFGSSPKSCFVSLFSFSAGRRSVSSPSGSSRHDAGPGTLAWPTTTPASASASSRTVVALLTKMLYY